MVLQWLGQIIQITFIDHLLSKIIVLRINPTGGPPGYGWNKNLTYRVGAVRAF